MTPINGITSSQSVGQSVASSCPTLKEVFETRTVVHPSGNHRKVVANISPQNSQALYAFVRHQRPQCVVEIGMAYAVSTLSILSGLAENGAGRCISIDPYIGWASGREVALHQVERAGFAGLHRHMHEPSYTALPRLIDDKTHVDLVYIDGNHNFDYAFTDFFLADKLISKGSVIAFNDCGWRSVHRVIKFLQKYRRYKELEVGLKRSFLSRNKFFELVKRIEGRSSTDRYFEKLENWEPECDKLRIPGP
jgi:predicted O-methyltransferase YrrM